MTPPETIRLDQRIALVTGASRGIGKAAAKALAQAGAHIIATARTEGALEELDDEIKAEGGSTTLVAMDLADRPAVSRLAQAVAERWRRLDIFVINAGILGILAPVKDIDEEIWDKVIDTNLSAAYRLIRAFDPLFRQAEAGRAIIVGDRIAHDQRPFWSAYAASKAGLQALAESWAAELVKTPHRVNLLLPDRIATSLHADAFPGIDPVALAQPQDIAPAFVALAAHDCPHHGQALTPEQLIHPHQDQSL